MKKRYYLPAALILALSVGWPLYHIFDKKIAPLIDQETQRFGKLRADTLVPVIMMRFDDPKVIKSLKEKIFKGKSSYKIIEDVDEGKVLQGLSNDTSSLLYREVKMDMKKTHPILTWEWKVAAFPYNKKNKGLSARSDNDFAGRIYVMFKGSSLFNSEVIQYVWDDYYETGHSDHSPFSSNVIVLVVEKGLKEEDSGWSTETRDVLEDYRMLFGKEPTKPLSAIGFMTDSDNTHTNSELFIKYIRLENAITDQPEI